MPKLLSLILCGLVAATAAASTSSPVFAQSSEAKGGEEKKTNGDGKKEPAKKADEIAEAALRLKGPAGQPECVWVGRRIVSLIWRDDLDTAERHRELYERFGCPSGHVQDAFRCLVRFGDLDPKVPESLNERVHACWIDPEQKLPVPAPVTAQPEAEKPAP